MRLNFPRHGNDKIHLLIHASMLIIIMDYSVQSELKLIWQQQESEPLGACVLPHRLR